MPQLQGSQIKIGGARAKTLILTILLKVKVPTGWKKNWTTAARLPDIFWQNFLLPPPSKYLPIPPPECDETTMLATGTP